MIEDPGYTEPHDRRKHCLEPLDVSDSDQVSWLRRRELLSHHATEGLVDPSPRDIMKVMINKDVKRGKKNMAIELDNNLTISMSDKESEATCRCQHVLPVERKLDPHGSQFLAAASRF